MPSRWMHYDFCPSSMILLCRLFAFLRSGYPQELLIELAISTYAQGILSFGKARELAGMGKYEFSQLLGKRDVTRHYSCEELEDDVTYGCGE